MERFLCPACIQVFIKEFNIGDLINIVEPSNCKNLQLDTHDYDRDNVLSPNYIPNYSSYTPNYQDN